MIFSKTGFFAFVAFSANLFAGNAVAQTHVHRTEIHKSVRIVQTYRYIERFRIEVSYRNAYDLNRDVNECQNFLDQTEFNSNEESGEMADALENLKSADQELSAALQNIKKGSQIAKDCRLNCAFSARTESLKGCAAGKSRLTKDKSKQLCQIFDDAELQQIGLDRAKDCPKENGNPVAKTPNLPEEAACLNYFAGNNGKISEECADSFANEMLRDDVVVVTGPGYSPDQQACIDSLADIGQKREAVKQAEKELREVESSCSAVKKGHIDPDYSATGTCLQQARAECRALVNLFSTNCWNCSTFCWTCAPVCLTCY